MGTHPLNQNVIAAVDAATFSQTDDGTSVDFSFSAVLNHHVPSGISQKGWALKFTEELSVAEFQTFRTALLDALLIEENRFYSYRYHHLTTKHDGMH